MILFLTLFACFNDCSYYERCDGDTLLVCGAAADQQFGRQENPFPCEAPNDVCVEVGEQNATCAYDTNPCDAGAAAVCDGDVLVACEAFDSAIGLSTQEAAAQSFLQGTDCAAAGQVCGTDADGAAACIDA